MAEFRELRFPRPAILADIAGAAIAADASSALWEDERFLEWLASEARARDDRRTSDVDAEARGRRLQAQAQARRHRVRLASTLPLAEAPSSEVETPHRCRLYTLGVAAGVGRELWEESADTWIELPRDLPRGDYLALRVVGESMAPLMHTGDTVLLRRGDAVSPESVIVARHPDDGYVCKVARRITPRHIELASLEPGRPAIIIPRDPSLVLGTVLLVWRRGTRG